MARKQDMSLTAALLWIVIAVAMITGWCMNIYQLVTSHDSGITAKLC